MNQLDVNFYPVAPKYVAHLRDRPLLRNMQVELVGLDNSSRRVLLDVICEVPEFLTWIVKNRQSILRENLPIPESGISIAETLFNFYRDDSGEEATPEKDPIFDTLYAYPLSHCWQFGLRGMFHQRYTSAFSNISMRFRLKARRRIGDMK